MEARIFQTRLKALRIKSGLTKKELAEKMGLSTESLSNYETGRRTPSIIVAADMAKCFDVSLDYLTGLSDNNGTSVEQRMMLDYTGLDQEALNRLHSIRNESDSARIGVTMFLKSSSTEVFELINNIAFQKLKHHMFELAIIKRFFIESNISIDDTVLLENGSDIFYSRLYIDKCGSKDKAYEIYDEYRKQKSRIQKDYIKADLSLIKDISHWNFELVEETLSLVDRIYKLYLKTESAVNIYKLYCQIMTLEPKDRRITAIAENHKGLLSGIQFEQLPSFFPYSTYFFASLDKE